MLCTYPAGSGDPAERGRYSVCVCGGKRAKRMGGCPTPRILNKCPYLANVKPHSIADMRRKLHLFKTNSP